MAGTAAIGDRGSSKRRKTSAGDTIDNLADLSGDTLAAIADYLPKTSRALLAVALTAPSAAWRERGWRGEPSAAARAILWSVTPSDPFSSILEMNCSEMKGHILLAGYEEELAREKQLQERRMQGYYGQGGWEILDFLDIEAGLASRLTDDDIGATLSCIDARSNLKKLYLTKCSGLVGHGLEPLRGSPALEQIDLKEQWKSKDNCFSLEVAFPIIGDILAGDASALRCMKVPPRWLMTSSKEYELFVRFLEGTKHVINYSADRCLFGFAGSEGDFVSRYLSEQRDTPRDRCTGCGGSSFMTCADCNTIICEDVECRLECAECFICDQCNKTSCRFCIGKGTASVTYCDDEMCSDYCDDCRYISCRGGGNDCQFCKGLVFDRLLQESTVQGAEMDRLRIENMELRQAQA